MPHRTWMPDLWRGGLSRPMRDMFSELVGPENEQFIPPCDIDETDNHFLVHFDLPGMTKKDVKIEVRDNQLIVSGERRHERKEEAKGRVSQERLYGVFIRTFVLPSNVNAEKIEANYENGVLQISIPKTHAAKGKEIPIKEGKLIESKPEKAA